MMYYGWGMAPFGWAGMALVSLFWLAVLVAVVVVTVRFTIRSGGSAAALDVLRQWLARGEITPDEYERDRKLLRS